MDLTALPVWGNLLVIGGLFAFLLFCGMWLAFAMLVVGLFILVFMVPGMGDLTGVVMFRSANNFVYLAAPLFMLMGQIVLKSGLGSKLYRGASKLTSVIPGGLVHSNIVACSLFAAVCGCSLATTATITTVALPEQEGRGYNRSLVKGSLAAGGTLGILIPPSVIMIIYGAFCGVSVARLFLGGFIPGIILAGMFMGYIAIISIIKPDWCPKPEKLSRAYFSKAISSLKDVWPFVVLFGFIMGSIYSGMATPTEAAAVSVLIVVLLAAGFRSLNFQIIKEATSSALQITGMIFIIVVAALVMAAGVSMIKLPADLTAWLLSFGFSRMMIWLVLMVMYLVLGCFMEIISMMLLTLPITFFLLVGQLGFDPVWFGIQLTILVECALITPPVGTNLYVIHAVGGGEHLEEVIIGVIPFFLLMVGAILLYTAFPELVTWLPTLVFGAY